MTHCFLCPILKLLAGTRLANDPSCRVSPTESENEMNLDELVAHLEVKTNILNEKRAEQEKYERGVKAMREADSVARI